MIVNKYNKGGGSSGVTPEQVQEQINSALTPYWESGITKEYVDSADTIIYASATSRMDDVEQVVSSALNEFHEQIMELSARTPDLSNYWTSAQTEDAISAATSGKADAVNIEPNVNQFKFPKWNAQGIITGSTAQANENWFVLNGSNYTPIFTKGNKAIKVFTPLSAGTAGDILVSTGSGAPVWSAVTMGGVSQEYVDSAITQVQDQIDTIDEVIPAAIVDLNERVDGFSDIELPISAAVNKLKGDFEARLDQQYYKKQEVNNLLKDKLAAEQVDVRIKNYTDPLFQAVYETIEDKELPISAALNELNEAIDLIDEVVPAALVNLNETKVGSDSVHTIWRGTQAAYDAITTKDASTLYIIVNE